ncbi:MAG: FG-GAP-like repeat-containing protein [Armatimonadota bacterium]|nr:FG-GAP-like repeat-containing protein [Armatimonadota bacterium]
MSAFKSRGMKLFVLIFLLTWVSGLRTAAPASAAAAWTSPDHYRVLLTVNPRISYRRNSPASVEIDFPQLLDQMGAPGSFDENTIEVTAYNASGQPAVYDGSRTGYEQYLLPWRIQRYYGLSRVTLSFVLPDQTYTQYAVYFDTKESGTGKPWRYAGLVGDGDLFRQEYGRREINACKFDSFADFDNDGDLDLFKGGVESYIYCYENVGSGEFVDRGKMTSGGQPWSLTGDGGRAWLTVEFNDWDSDGDQDLFASFTDGPDEFQIVIYENVTAPGGYITFSKVGYLLTKTLKPLGSSWFAAPTVVDWDGDGKKDFLVAKDDQLVFYKNVSPTNSIRAITLNDGVYVRANGTEINIFAGRADCADIDSDGDLDLFMGTQDGHIFWFKNVGTRTAPILTTGRLIAFYEFMDAHSWVKVADFDGDGLLDLVPGRFWERTHFGEQDRVFGRMYKNVGTATSPRFEARDADQGAPYIEQFQICDAVRQNGVRAADWNEDGKLDLIASDTDGFVWFFRNTTNSLFPVFAPGEKLMADDKAVRVYAEDNWGGYARADVADWNNDGRKDLLVADGRGWLTLYLNVGSASGPLLGAGTRVFANNKPIDGSGRCTVLVCDWDNDGKKDVIFGMTGEGTSDYYDWPSTAGESAGDSGFLFYRNVGADANPSLAYPSWVAAGLTRITYNVRPNLGEFIDWDGDGKKDFIASEFESDVRWHRNTAAVNGPPEFGSTTGSVLVTGPCQMLVSGADALDWNSDEDIDILTGQGHGGSGLRFYERDYVKDMGSGLYPIVTLGASSRGYDIAAAKTAGGTGSIAVPQGVVTAVFTDYFYVEQTDRSSGIRVQKANHGLAIGQMVDVTGTVSIVPDGETYIAAGSVTANGSGAVSELMLNSRALGGADFGSPSSGSGQYGVEGGVGVNNIGLLVGLIGKCSLNLSSTGDYYNKRYLFVDDGGGANSVYRHADGSYRLADGVKVDVNDPSIAEGSYLSVRGISSIELVNGIRQGRILARPGMGDVQKV